jgi:hypothetical protein
MAFRFRIAIDVAAFERAVETTTTTLQRREWLERIGDRWMTWVRSNFQGQGSARLWRPPAPATLAAGGGGGGSLLGTFRAEVQRDSRGDRVAVHSRSREALWFQKGTPPHPIRPRERQFVVFQTDRGLIFSRQVDHPGQPRRRLVPPRPLAREMAVEIVAEGVQAATQPLRSP